LRGAWERLCGWYGGQRLDLVVTSKSNPLSHSGGVVRRDGAL